MPQPNTDPRSAAGNRFQTGTIWQRLKELDMFFQGKDPVHKCVRRLAKRLDKANIPYAIVGGMAVLAHHYRRSTDDVDVLLTSEGFDEFQRRFVPKKYERLPGRARRFVDRANEVTLDVLVTGFFPGTGKPGPIAFPDPAAVGQSIDNVRILDLVTLIQLKLAARRYQDYADVVNLISANNLDEFFAEQLHPSVRRDYVECLEEKRREDEYEACQG
jgi:hypothetical protein